MNIIQMKQEKRTNQISEIRNSIKLGLEKNPQLDYKSIILSVQSNLCLSKRTSQEYIDVALFELGKRKDELWKPKKT